jgi:hypothetical protein
MFFEVIMILGLGVNLELTNDPKLIPARQTLM